MRPLNVTIEKIIEESPSIRTFIFDHTFENVKPGQFVMVWARGVDEVPMGLSRENSITVQKIGEATKKLFELKPGDSFGLRGPFGNGYTPASGKEKILIVAGGVGAAPLAPYAEASRTAGAQVQTILGARTARELVFEERFSAAGSITVTTDDGSKGTAGFVTGILSELDVSEYTRICVCGPEPMMKAVLAILKDKGAAKKAEFSIQRYFKCAIGVCGACCLDPKGLRVCKDGPVFSGEQLLDSEFGNYSRDASGRRVRF